MNKIIIGSIAFVAFSFLSYWMKFSLPPSFKYSHDFDLNKTVHTFDILLRDGNYRLGFYSCLRNMMNVKQVDMVVDVYMS